MKPITPMFTPRKSDRDVHLETLRILLSEEEHGSVLRAKVRMMAIRGHLKEVYEGMPK